MTNTINLIAENVAEGDCSIFLTKWTKSGHFTGSDLFGVKATGKPIVIHGFSCIETKGAQITRMDCTMVNARGGRGLSPRLRQGGQGLPPCHGG
jgi:hypothetical protein